MFKNAGNTIRLVIYRLLCRKIITKLNCDESLVLPEYISLIEKFRAFFSARGFFNLVATVKFYFQPPSVQTAFVHNKHIVHIYVYSVFDSHEVRTVEFSTFQSSIRKTLLTIFPTSSSNFIERIFLLFYVTINLQVPFFLEAISFVLKSCIFNSLLT